MKRTRRLRLPTWRLTTWLIIAWTVAFAVAFILRLWPSVLDALDPFFTLQGKLRVLEGGVAASLRLVGPWASGFIVLSLLWLLVDRARGR